MILKRVYKIKRNLYLYNLNNINLYPDIILLLLLLLLYKTKTKVLKGNILLDFILNLILNHITF